MISAQDWKKWFGLRWLGTVVTSHTASDRQAYTPVMSMLQKAVQSTHCTSCNRPIVLLRPGHEVRGIPAVRSCKKRCFLCFSEALSWPSMALNDCLSFSASLKDTVDVWWCARPALGQEKVQIGATFTLAGVASLLQSLRVSRLDLSSARATFKMNNLGYLTLEENASLDNS